MKQISERISRSYDEIGALYTEHRQELSTALRYLDDLTAILPPNGTVLDVGCGAGTPIVSTLISKGFEVRGVDISPRQIERARELNPQAVFEVRDMLELKPRDYTVDAVVSFFALFHVPRQLHVEVLATWRSFLSDGGLLLVTMGAREAEGWDEFFGAEMYWSHYGPEANRSLVEQAGFTVLIDQVDVHQDERHQVLLARSTPA